jgi:hypothetical protein
MDLCSFKCAVILECQSRQDCGIAHFCFSQERRTPSVNYYLWYTKLCAFGLYNDIIAADHNVPARIDTKRGIESIAPLWLKLPYVYSIASGPEPGPLSYIVLIFSTTSVKVTRTHPPLDRTSANHPVSLDP